MASTLGGFLYGTICTDLRVLDGVPDAELVAVPATHRPTPKAPVGEVAEQLFHRLFEAPGVLLGRTDEGGAITFKGDRYDGRLELYARIRVVPARMASPPTASLRTPMYLYLGSFQPESTPDGPAIVAYIPAVAWAACKRRADVWSIAGVVESTRDRTPIAGARVSAFDADFLQDDFLGSADTDSRGIFRIDYAGEAYRRGTLLDVELFGGPDVYFVVKDAGGATLLEEDRAEGRIPGRADSTPCLCVRLAASARPGAARASLPGDLAVAWTGIGTSFTLPSGGALNDFDAQGYAGAARYALTSTLRLTGSAPRASASGRRVEYRFRVSDATQPNGGGNTPAESSFLWTVGGDPDRALFAPVRVGQMVRHAPFRILDVWAQAQDLDAQGWLDVDRSVRRTFAESGLSLGELPSFHWIDLDALMGLDTRYLTSLGLTKAAIRFEIREVIDRGAGTFAPLPGHGTTLCSLQIDNSEAAWTLEAHAPGHACEPLSSPPKIAYSAAHPHLASVAIHVRNNDSTYAVELADAPGGLPLAGNTDPKVRALGPATIALPAEGLKKCTYLVTLSITRRLHTGDAAVSGEQHQTMFYYGM